jgi:hypothetical protein
MNVRIDALPRPTPLFSFSLEFTDKFGKRRRRIFELVDRERMKFVDREAPI